MEGLGEGGNVVPEPAPVTMAVLPARETAIGSGILGMWIGSSAWRELELIRDYIDSVCGGGTLS